MRQLRIQKQIEDKIFKVSMNPPNSIYNPSLYKTSNIKIKTDINNQSPEDLYYDEIIYYDGGGVEGYGN